MSRPNGRVVFVAGLSGSGKSTAMAALEDLGFYCVDNLPAQLTRQLLDLCAVATPPIESIALAITAREEPFLRRFPEVVKELRESGRRVETLFLECGDAVLVNRYRETRRVHPLSPEGSVRDGIERERRLLGELAGLADICIDTSTLNVHQLKEALVQHVSGQGRATVVNLTSFGFRYGPPAAAETLFDVRCLPNPYFDAQLRPRSGQDAEVSAFVLERDPGRALFDRLVDLLEFLLPLYDREGKAYVTIGVGCTGGRHRSVAVVEALARQLRAARREVNVEHRDLEKST